MPAKRYELILIDADDTLFDFRACEDGALREAFALEGMSFDEAAAAAYREINTAAWKRVEEGLATQARIKYERFELLLERLGNGGNPRSLAEAYIESLSAQRVLIRGALEAVAHLAGRSRLVLVTNGIARVQRGRIGASALRAYFEDIVISEEVGFAKPDPRIFARAAEIGGYENKAGMLMIGDSLSSDIAGAIAFGIDSCWYNPARASSGPLAPTYQVAELSEFLDLF